MLCPTKISNKNIWPDFNRFTQKIHAMILKMLICFFKIFKHKAYVSQARIALVLVRSRRSTFWACVMEKLDQRIAEFHVHNPGLRACDTNYPGQRRIKLSIEGFFHSNNFFIEFDGLFNIFNAYAYVIHSFKHDAILPVMTKVNPSNEVPFVLLF